MTVVAESRPVLDKGYVRLVGLMRHFGTDAEEVQVVNAARASYEKEVTELGKRDVGLINFLVRRVENSPFRHSTLAFEVRAPLMVARQWWKYSIGSAHLVDDDANAWNEGSRRYLTEEPEFYVPGPSSPPGSPRNGQWRAAPEHSKQGSAGEVEAELAWTLQSQLGETVRRGVSLYTEAIAQGVCAEQARLFLPAYGLYVRWRWTASLLAVLHFLDERLAHKAQVEMQRYAVAVRDLAEPHFPHSFGMLE